MLALTFAFLLGGPIFLLSAANGGLRLELVAADLSEAAVALIMLMLTLLFLAAISLGFTIAITLWTAQRKLSKLRRGAIRVGPEQFPAFHTIAESVRATLGVATPVSIYVMEAARLPHAGGPISVLGVLKPYTIMMTSALVNDIEPEELKFLLGIEYGHVKLGHVRVLTMIDAVSGSLGRVPFVGGFISLIFLGWTRLSTYSADRAGLIAGGNLAAAYDIFGKLTVGRKLWAEVNHVALAQQVSRTTGRFHAAANRTTLPFDTAPLGRFQRLVIFSHTPIFAELCPHADLSFEHMELWQ